MYYGTPPIVTNGCVFNLDPSNWAQQTSRNLYDYTTDLTNAYWIKARCQITASAGIAPDGTNTAFAMTITDTTGLVRLTAGLFTASVEGGPYTFSCYVSKSITCSAGIINLGIYNGGQTVGIEPEFAIQANFTPTGSTNSSTVNRTTSVGNGWFRISSTTTLTSSVHSFSNFIDLENGLNNNKANGDVVYLWKPQFEAGNIATQPQDIPTTVRFSTDLSGNNNTGSFSTRRPTWTPNNGGSIAFLAPSVNSPTLTFPSTPSINVSGSSMSGEIWIKFTRLDYTTNSGSLISLFRKGNPDSATPNNGFWIAYDNRANRSGFSYTCFGNSAGGFAGGGNNFGDVAYYTVFTTGSWNHIAFTINNSTGSFYINGVQKGPSKNFSNLNIYDTGSGVTGETYFDVAPSGPSPFEIGALRLYNRALSQNEISRNYNALKTRFGLT